MSVVEAEKMVMQILKNNMEDKICKDNVELMVIKTSTKKWERRTEQEMDTMIKTLS